MSSITNKFFETVKSSDFLSNMGSNSTGTLQPHKDRMSITEIVFRRDKYAHEHKLLHAELDKIIDFSLNRPNVGEHGVFLRKLGFLIKESNLADWEPEFHTVMHGGGSAVQPADEQFEKQFKHYSDFAKAPTPKLVNQKVSTQQTVPKASPMDSRSQIRPQSQTQPQTQSTSQDNVNPQVQDSPRIHTPTLAMAHLMTVQSPVIPFSSPSPALPNAQISMSPPRLSHAQYYATLQNLASKGKSSPKTPAKRKRKSKSFTSPSTPPLAKSQKLNSDTSPSKLVDYSQYHAAIVRSPQQQYSNTQQQVRSSASMPKVVMRVLSQEEMLCEIPPYSDPYQHNGAWWVAVRYWINEEIIHINLSSLGAQVIGNGKVMTRGGRISPIGQLAKVYLLSNASKHHLCPPWLLENFRRVATMKQRTSQQMPTQPMRSYCTQVQMANVQQRKLQQGAIVQARHQPLLKPLPVQTFAPLMSNGAEMLYFGTQAWLNEPFDFSDVPEMIRRMNEDTVNKNLHKEESGLSSSSS
jgi:hypothetical protein